MEEGTKPRVLQGWAVVNEKGGKTEKTVYYSAHQSRSGTIEAHCLKRKQSWNQCRVNGDRIVRYDVYAL